MNKLNLRLLVLVFTILTISGASAAVYHAEQEKRLNKYIAEKNYYTDLYNEWALYKSQYAKQVADLKIENKKNMDAAKQNYEKLLAQQPALVAEHTRVVQDGTVTQSNNPAIGNVTSSGTKTKTVAVVKPKSKPKAKTS